MNCINFAATIAIDNISFQLMEVQLLSFFQEIQNSASTNLEFVDFQFQVGLQMNYYISQRCRAEKSIGFIMSRYAGALGEGVMEPRGRLAQQMVYMSGILPADS